MRVDLVETRPELFKQPQKNDLYLDIIIVLQLTRVNNLKMLFFIIFISTFVRTPYFDCGSPDKGCFFLADIVNV